MTTGRSESMAISKFKEWPLHAGEPAFAHVQFERNVRLYPARPAVMYGDDVLTYAELNAKANQLAHALIERGVTAGAAVGICFTPRIETIVSMLGIMKAGAAYVPLDPINPAERLVRMVDQVDAMRWMIVSDEHAPIFVGSDRAIIFAEEMLSAIAHYPTTDPCMSSKGDDLCYIVFTSGTTGTPKAVAIRHSGWSNLLGWLKHEYALDSTSSGLLVSSFGFDISQRSLMTPLFNGATLHLMRSTVFDSALARRIIAQHRVRTLHCAPSILYLLTGPNGGDALPSPIEYVFIGGEALSVARIAEWSRNEGRNCRLVHQYGVAECTDVAASYVMQDMNRYLATGVPIGDAVYRCAVHVLDEGGKPVTVGQIGEIYLSGKGVGAGYLKNPELNAERFVDISVDDEAIAAYRTGDFARVLESGEVVCLGRRDRQIKIRGMLVNLADIEVAVTAVLGAAINEVLVLPVKPVGAAPNIDPILAAFAVPGATGADAINIGDTRLKLVQHLPRHMIPEKFVIVDAYPLTQNGKVDRDRLASLAFSERNQFAMLQTAGVYP